MHNRRIVRINQGGDIGEISVFYGNHPISCTYRTSFKIRTLHQIHLLIVKKFLSILILVYVNNNNKSNGHFYTVKNLEDNRV